MITKTDQHPPTTHSHQFQLFHNNSRQQQGYVNHYSIELITFSSEYKLFNNCKFNLVYRHSLSVKLNSVYYSVMVTRYCTYSCFVLLKMGDSETRNMQSSSQIKINSVTCASCWEIFCILFTHANIRAGHQCLEIHPTMSESYIRNVYATFYMGQSPPEQLIVAQVAQSSQNLTFWHRGFTFNSNKSPT